MTDEEKAVLREQNSTARKKARAKMTYEEKAVLHAARYANMTDEEKAVLRDQDTTARNKARAKMTDEKKAVFRYRNTHGRKTLRKKNSVVKRDRARDAVHAACKAGILLEPEDIDE